jgi:hypothetical protein
MVYATAHSQVPPAPRTVHVYVALCDNDHQGIVPVRAELGNGDDPNNNLYWGAQFGVRQFFEKSTDWARVSVVRPVSDVILERCVFEHRNTGVYLIADAYRGREIKAAVEDFLYASAGAKGDTLDITVGPGQRRLRLPLGGDADLLAYIGHDGLMDFSLPAYPTHADEKVRRVIVLACVSKDFFSPALREAGAYPLLWTTGLMAPEAYTLKGALDGWIVGETDEEIRGRAARTYADYQKCSLAAAARLLVTGW